MYTFLVMRGVGQDHIVEVVNFQCYFETFLLCAGVVLGFEQW